MEHPMWGAVLAAQMGLLLGGEALAATTDLGEGYRDHGVATPISNHRGTVATQDGNGRDIVLSWLMDHRGVYALLLLDAETGQSEIFDIPYPWAGDSPFASILSSRNRFYTHYGSHFLEFDPAQRKFTFFQKTVPNMAMSMTEDDQGRIWAATYPNSGVVCYDPATGQLRDYGHVYKQNWAQYQRSIAADDTGWIYFAVGNTNSQIISLNPESGEAKPLLAENERKQGSSFVYRDENGKVYGQALAGNNDLWLELYRGERRMLDAPPDRKPKRYIAESQGLFHRQFPSGRVLRALNLVDRVLEVEDSQTKEVKKLPFDYPSEGAHIMGVATAPDGTICGGTAFPMRFFSYNPATDTWINRPGYGQFNTVAPAPDRFFIGGYGHGFLLEWDPAQPWKDTVKADPEGNPRWLAEAAPSINRPHDLLAHPDGRWVILAGTPGYGYTGGGLYFCNRQANQGVLVEHQHLIPEQSTMALAALPDGKTIVGGTTIAAGTGGEVKATVAELYLLDLETRRIQWHAPLLEDARNYMDMWVGPNGLVYGVADRTRFFVFDPARREIVHEQDTSETLGNSVSAQGSRIFVPAPDGTIYMLYNKGVVTLNPETYEQTLISQPEVALGGGGDWHDGRIYFIRGSHLCSWQVP